MLLFTFGQLKYCVNMATESWFHNWEKLINISKAQIHELKSSKSGANSWLCHSGHVTMKFYLYCMEIELLACHYSHNTVIWQQSSIRGLYRFVARLTATGNPFCPQYYHPQWLYEILDIIFWDENIFFVSKLKKSTRIYQIGELTFWIESLNFLHGFQIHL